MPDEPARLHTMPDPDALPRPWLSSYPPGVPPTYTYPDVALPRFLDDAVRDFPTATALHHEGAELTYAELGALVDRFAGALRDLGIGRGDRVGIALPNLPASVIATFAVLRLGAVVVHADPGFTADELRIRLADADVGALVALTPLLPRIEEIRRDLPSLGHVIVTGVEDWLPFTKRLLFPLVGRRDGRYRPLEKDDDALSMPGLIDAADPVRGQVPVEAGDLALIQYTGGTTEASRGVRLTHGNLVANAFQARLWVPDIQAGRETVLVALPLFHVYGLVLGLFTGVLAAATMVLVARPEPGELLAAIESTRPTIFPGVPKMYRGIVDHPRVDRTDLTSIRACVSGAAPLPGDVIRRFERLTEGARLREGYGLSEASPLTHANPIYGRAEPGHLGLPVTDTVAAVVDVDDPTHVLPPGEPGQLIVHGPQVMDGYWRDPDATAATLRGGWLLTGDVVVRDEDGVFTFVDRLEDLMVVDGRRVYPREVEAVLERHPDVVRASVVGVPGARGDEHVRAFVIRRPGARAGSPALAEHCRQHLAAHELPVTIEVREALPESQTGKVLRRELRAEVLARPGDLPYHDGRDGPATAEAG